MNKADPYRTLPILLRHAAPHIPGDLRFGATELLSQNIGDWTRSLLKDPSLNERWVNKKGPFVTPADANPFRHDDVLEQSINSAVLALVNLLNDKNEAPTAAGGLLQAHSPLASNALAHYLMSQRDYQNLGGLLTELGSMQHQVRWTAVDPLQQALLQALHHAATQHFRLYTDPDVLTFCYLILNPEDRPILIPFIEHAFPLQKHWVLQINLIHLADHLGADVLDLISKAFAATTDNDWKWQLIDAVPPSINGQRFLVSILMNENNKHESDFVRATAAKQLVSIYHASEDANFRKAILNVLQTAFKKYKNTELGPFILANLGDTELSSDSYNLTRDILMGNEENEKLQRAAAQALGAMMAKDTQVDKQPSEHSVESDAWQTLKEAYAKFAQNSSLRLHVFNSISEEAPFEICFPFSAES
jgi:hypothetical protein